MFLRQIKSLALRRPTAIGAAILGGSSRNVSNICSSTNNNGALLNPRQALQSHYLLENNRRNASTIDNTHKSTPNVADDSTTATPATEDSHPDDGTAASLLAKWRLRFEAENVPEVDSSLRNILAHVLGVKRLDTDPASVRLNAEQLDRFAELCECRMVRMPIQYIIGEWDFRDLTLQMRPPVFIPRPETEELVELVLQQIDVKRAMRFLEIGCGSGAISLALLKSLPKAVGVAIDQSAMAVELTQSNAARHQLDGRLTVRQEKLTRDTLAVVGASAVPVEEGAAVQQAGGAVELVDLIVSNPPYVPNKQLRGLEPEVKIYEDLRALDGGIDGMETIESILWLAAKRLRPATGVLWLEVDPSHPELIQKYIADHADTLSLKFVASYQDIFRKDRFVEIVRV